MSNMYDELAELRERHERRLKCWESHKDWLEPYMYISRGKGSRTRKLFVTRLRWIAEKEFEDEESEYQAVNKFHRGVWEDKNFKVFSEEEREKLIDMAREYGAFDY